MKKLIAYKGFDKNMKCRGFQFEVGKEYKHNGDVKVCNSGFHACINPLDCFSYYDPGNSIFCEVELSGKIEKHNEDSKVCAEKIKVLRILSMAEFSKIVADYCEKNDKKPASNTGDKSSASNTGDCSSASNTGDCSSASNTGY